MHRPTFLMCGLPSDNPAALAIFPPAVTDEKVKLALEEVTAAGFDPKPFPCPPELGSRPLIEELKQNTYDAVLIGFGVRSQPDLTAFFEALVDAVREHAPRTKLVFNGRLGTTIDALKRNFPDVQ